MALDVSHKDDPPLGAALPQIAPRRPQMVALYVGTLQKHTSCSDTPVTMRGKELARFARSSGLPDWSVDDSVFDQGMVFRYAQLQCTT